MHFDYLQDNTLINNTNVNVAVTLFATIEHGDVSREEIFYVTIQKTVSEGDVDLAYYDPISDNASGSALKAALRTLITNTHKYKTSYDDCKAYLPDTDEDPNNKNNMILFYSGVSIKKAYSCGNSVGEWNREHVWPKSLAWYETSGAGADLHHIRPTNGTVNSTRNNNKFGIASSGNMVYYPNTTIVSGKLNGYFEPNDNVKGDVARIIFYLMTRYSESDRHSWSDVCTGYELLKSWNSSDPVDSWERHRNEAIYEIQGNRNPFIDNQGYATMIWG